MNRLPRCIFLARRGASRRAAGSMTLVAALGIGLWAATAALAQMPTPLPPGLDPNEPGISREEQINRMRQLVEMQMRIRAETEAARRTLESRGAAPPGAQPSRPAAPGAPSVPRAGQPAAGVPNRGVAPPTGVAPGAPARGGAPGVRGRGAPPPPPAARSPFVLTEKARIPHATLFLSPASLAMNVGEEAAMEVRIANPDGLSMDEIRVRLSYPSAYLEPVSVHQDAIAPLLGEEPAFDVRPEQGLLSWSGRLAKPVGTQEQRVLTIVWRALASADHLRVLTRNAEGGSDVLHAGVSITEGNPGVAAGATDARVRIVDPRRARAAGFRWLNPAAADVWAMLAGFPDQRSLRPPTLWIAEPPGERFEPGQEVVLELGIDNPDRMVFDEIRLAGRFDPEALEPIDVDEGNWIARGINLHDGPFRDRWPWDRHYENRVDPESGMFYYRMAMATPREQPSGPVARLRLRVKRPIAPPLVSWLGSAPADVSTPTTGVYLFGENVYERAAALARNEPAQAPPGRADAAAGERADPALYRF